MQAASKNPTIDDAAELTPLPAVLNVVGDELTHLAAAVEKLHDIVELPGVRDSLREAHCYNVLQGIDHVTQSLAGLSEFLTVLACSVPSEWSLDTAPACDVVLLASLCERLKRPTDARQAAVGNNECEFF